MNAVIYARYSSDNQREESIEGQLRECKEYADQNGITVVRTYIDCALSAKTDRRPQFQQMIHDSATHTFEVVLVWKLDRFSRNRYDSTHYKRILENRPGPCGVGDRIHLQCAGGYHAGKSAGRHGRILFGGANREGQPWSQGECPQDQVQRRPGAAGLPY